MDTEARRAVIASRLRAAREHSGLSQGQVAKLLSMSRPTITEAEAGRRRVPAEELVLFATTYGVSVGWLAGEESDVLDPTTDEIALAARELAKLKPEDRETVRQVLAMIRGRR